MIIGCSKELYKVEVDFTHLEIEKLQAHEVFGLYLIGEITFNKLKEIFQNEHEDLHLLIKRVCEDIEKTSKKDESQVEMDIG